ncbi:MAG: DUF1292 domain-containing protein [Firmicutes bacterium]|nr:DUF1292 domain-containing protein [Dethiobacter sp.]MBS3889261.1 DUF1292 domain-containing protein [Bacillota bacterium]MBS4054475.1 DUF1292 domain-containing protein [Thermaerobacter sp.]
MNEERREEVIVLTDEEGNEYEFEVVQVLEVDGNKYAVLFPLNDEDIEDDEAIIMRIEKGEDGEDIIVDIEDDAEWEKVVAEWELFLDEEGDDDCEDDDEEGHSHEGCACGGEPTKK